jgi:hypothetical protein
MLWGRRKAEELDLLISQVCYGKDVSLTVVSHNVEVYKNVSTTSNEDLLY